MPITVRDVKAFFRRHRRLSGQKEIVIKMAEGSKSPDGSINCEAAEWIFPGTELVEQFFAELDCLKI